jgi:hypothetical protein
METRETLSTRELAGHEDTTGERSGRFDREAHDPTSVTADQERRDPALERDRDVASTEDATAASEDRSASTADIRDDSPDLLPSDENAEFQRRWETIQTGFVDEPRQTVEQADELVAQVMKRLAEGFAAERERLEGQWGRGEDVSTEDLRIALQRYRAFFQRLLSA